METVLFWILAVGAVASALLVVLPPLARNPIYSALALVGTFLFLAGIYVLLVAHLVAVLQVLVYAGAIMVLFVFVIMLLNLQPHELKPTRVTPARILGAVAGVFVLFKLGHLLVSGTATMAGTDVTVPLGKTVLGDPVYYGTVKHVGQALFGRYLVPFELLSILMLVAIIGAVVLAKRSFVGDDAVVAAEPDVDVPSETARH